MFNFIKSSFDPFLADEGKTKSIRSNLFVSVNKMHHQALPMVAVFFQGIRIEKKN